jgi:hypothetical protein
LIEGRPLYYRGGTLPVAHLVEALRYSRKVADWIPDGVTEIFH